MKKCNICKVNISPRFALLVARVIVGAIFLVHGVQKYQMGAFNVANFFASLGIPFAPLMAWIVIVVEIVGGIALILGAFTGIAATLLFVTMLVAVLTSKVFKDAEYPLAMIASLITIGALGAGRYSLGSVMCKCGAEKICEGTCGSCSCDK